MEFTHIHHTSSGFLEEFYKNYEPVFVLNTGRSGSAFLNKIFKELDDVMAYHEASPNMFLQSNFAFHNQEKQEVLFKMFQVARVELMLQAKVENKIFLETNQCNVFFSYQIKKMFPKAKFIHITRHPGDFVRSAIRKGWHKNDSVWELGRIKMDDSIAWNELDQVQKLSWVWYATHEFIEKFKTTCADQCLTVRLEDLLKDHKTFKKMLGFSGSKISIKKSKFKNLVESKENELHIAPNEPSNMFKVASFPKYSNWSAEMKERLKSMTLELSDNYKYQLD